jgi:2-hydroxycyclohexanecarboxyl-CoA dehydrogenase
MARLTNRTALITGGGAGIGKACALLFCREGAAVTLVDADAAALERTVEAIRSELPNAKVTHFTANVADDALAMAAVKHAVDMHGRLDILVNNAAMRNYSAVADATPAEWQAMVNVNLIGCANYCRAALPHLRGSESASIVNVSSCYAVAGRKGMGIYDATKAYGVRVNAVCPGSTLTDFHISKAEAKGMSVEKLKTERQDTSLLGRWATPDEIAYPVLWLASSESSFMTGTTVMVDGGLHIM